MAVTELIWSLILTFSLPPVLDLVLLDQIGIVPHRLKFRMLVLNCWYCLGGRGDFRR